MVATMIIRCRSAFGRKKLRHAGKAWLKRLAETLKDRGVGWIWICQGSANQPAETVKARASKP